MEIRTRIRECRLGQLKKELTFPDFIADIPDDVVVWACCVEKGKDVLSTVICIKPVDRKKQAQLFYVYTDPMYRRKKFSKIALYKMKRALKEKGVRSIFCKVTDVSQDVQWWFYKIACEFDFIPILLDGSVLKYSFDNMTKEGCPLLQAMKGDEKRILKGIQFISRLKREELRAISRSDLIRENAIDLYEIKNNPEYKDAILYMAKSSKTGKWVVLGYLELTLDNSTLLISNMIVHEGKNSRMYAAILLYSAIKHNSLVKYGTPLSENGENDATLYIQSVAKRQTELYRTLLGEPGQIKSEQEYLMVL